MISKTSNSWSDLRVGQGCTVQNSEHKEMRGFERAKEEGTKR